MSVETWSEVTFDGDSNFHLMTTTGTQFLDNSIGLDTESRQPWYLLDSIRQYELQTTVGGRSVRPSSGWIYPRGDN